MVGEIRVRIATDMMSALACIEEGNNPITEEYVMERLKQAGVSVGIIKEKVAELVQRECLRAWVTVAEGKLPGETKPAYFEYFFNHELQDSKTVINPDGSVQYGKHREMVATGDKLCEYHPPVTGAFGYTVFSSVIAPKPARELTLKCGEGVIKQDNTYFAEVDGEVVLQKDTITVNNILVINGDAKYGIDSNTKFVGDIHIKGDVLSGVSITANGNIEVDGTVEACKIIAGKDIIIHGGVKGDWAAEICAKGSVICPYIENAGVVAEDSIQTDYVMQSKLVAGNSVIVRGKHGTIIGGQTIAKNELVVTEAGNEAGVDTVLEIKNDDIKNIEYSRIIIGSMSYENVFMKFNGVTFRKKIFPTHEYHLVNGEIVWCEIGKYVPMKEFVIDEPVKVKKSLLLVDDEPIILKTFFSYLNEEYNVMLATSAKDARAQLEQKVPDLILLDYMMPEMNGAEFLESIRKTTWKIYTNVPVIFVTAVNDKETIANCFKLYPQGYLLKPLGKDELLEALNKYFDNIL